MSSFEHIITYYNELLIDQFHIIKYPYLALEIIICRCIISPQSLQIITITLIKERVCCNLFVHLLHYSKENHPKLYKSYSGKVKNVTLLT